MFQREARNKDPQQIHFQRKPTMSKIVLSTLLAAMVLLAQQETASAQLYGSTTSSSYSNNYSRNWGNATSYGPGGFYRGGYDNRTGGSTASRWNGVYSPYGGVIYSSNNASGFVDNSSFSRGTTPYGTFFNNNYGNFNASNNGGSYLNSWYW